MHGGGYSDDVDDDDVRPVPLRVLSQGVVQNGSGGGGSADGDDVI